MEYTFYLTINRERQGTPNLAFDCGAMAIDHSPLHPSPLIVDGETRTLVVLGSPIHQGKLLSREQLKALDLPYIRQHIGDFNGQFGIYLLEKARGRFYAFTDRTASYPVFYFQESEALTCSLSYGDIWRRDVGVQEIDPDAFYEFLVLRRLMGTKTYDRKSKFLPSFSYLAFDLQTHGLEVVRYDTLDFEKSSHSFKKQAGELAERIVSAVQCRLTDHKSCGLLLSGGLDSRVSLAARKGVFTCFTLGHDKTNEYRVAHEAATLDGHEHHFVQVPANHLDLLYPQAVFACDGMRDFFAASWATVGPRIAERNIDVLFSGYALDYLNGDNYLPRTQVKLFGRYPTHISRYRPVESDLASFFLDSISWRYKSTPVADLFRSSAPTDRVRDTICSELAVAKGYSDVPLDQYLFLTVNNLSRHSMYIESSLMRPFVEDRVPGLDKEVFDFSLKIPYAFKSNYKLYKRAISLIDPRYPEIVTTNTNHKARYGPYRATGQLFVNMIRSKLGLSHIFPPVSGDRNWGSSRFMFENNPDVRSRLENYRGFVMWDMLPELDTDHLFDQIEGHISGQRLNLILASHLLSIEAFLKAVA